MVMVKTLQKILFFLLAIISASAFAGGVETAPVSVSGLYVEGNLGYSYRNWRNDAAVLSYIANAQNGTTYGAMSNELNGFTFGGDLGYQLAPIFAFETGWYYLPTFRYTVPTGNIVPANNSIKVDSWFLYFGGKLMLPFYRHAFIFGKLAAAYISDQGHFTSALNTAAITVAGMPASNNYWAPLFATGIQYDINLKLSVNVQYLFITGYQNQNVGGPFIGLPSPNVNLFTVGFGYKFIS